MGGILPKVAQFGTTLISLHNPEVLTTLGKKLISFTVKEGEFTMTFFYLFKAFGLKQTHAHMFAPGFDEIEDTLQSAGWIYGRQGDSYSKLAKK